MDRYIEWLEKHKYKLIIMITLFTVLLSIVLKDIAYEGSYRIWFAKDSNVIKRYDNFRDTFSGDDQFSVAFKDENGIFTPKAIQTILTLTDEFERIEGVRRVDSLTNYQNITSDADDIVVDDFILNIKNLNDKKVQALKDSLILNQLISKDGLTTMIAVKLSNSVSTNEEVNIFVMDKLQKLVDKASATSGYTFYITGVPAVTASLVTISQRDALILTPLAVLIVVVLLFFFFRNIIGILIPSIVVVYTFLIVLSIQILLGYKLNNFTVSIPSFIAAIAIADAMHLYLAWVYYKLKEYTTKDAVKMALQKNMLPIALTSFTTAVGFASLGVSNIVPISTLGIAISTGAVIAFLLSISIAPAILLLLPSDHPVEPLKFLSFANVEGYGRFIAKHDKKIIFLFILFSMAILYGLKDLKVDSNSIKYFQEDTVVRSGSTFLEKEITGSVVYELVLDSKEPNGAKNPTFLSTIIQFEKAFYKKYKNIRATTSLKDIIARMHKTLDKSAIDDIPHSNNLVAQYMLLYSMSLAQDRGINDKIDIDERYLRLTFNSDIQDTSKDLEMIEWIHHWWQEHGYGAEVQGQASIFTYMQADVTKTLLYSISVTLFFVTFMMLLIFRNLKILWIFILPNILPIALIMGFMGYFRLNIDIGVAISAAVILGIIVDDTIHFFSKYFDAMKAQSFEKSIDSVLKHSGQAIVYTTVILSFTFSIFIFSRFVPNNNFAIVTITTLNIALLFDLIVLPALLSLFLNKLKRKNLGKGGAVKEK